MNLENLNLEKLLNTSYLSKLDLLNEKVQKVSQSFNNASSHINKFETSLFSSGDNPGKRIKEVQVQLEKLRTEEKEKVDKLIKDLAIAGISYLGPPGLIASFIMSAYESSGETELREHGITNDGTYVSPKKIKGETISAPKEYIPVGDPRWTEYFKIDREKTEVYNKNHEIIRQSTDGESMVNPGMVMSILSIFDKRLNIPGLIYDTVNGAMDVLGVQQKILDAEAEIEKLKEQQRQEENISPTAPSNFPTPKPRDNEIAGLENSGSKNLSAGSNFSRTSQTEFNNSGLNEKQRGHLKKNNGSSDSKSKEAPDPVETMVGVFGEVQKVGGAMSTLMQTLNIGADTFVGGIINGFNSALSIIQTMITVMQAVNTIKMFLPFATGGSVPGIGDTDSVPAMLTPGEYVVKKSVVNKFGSGFFEWINGGGLTNSLAGHYAGGGMVAAAGKQMVAVSIPDVKIKGSDLYLSWRRENNTHGRRSI